MNWGLVVAIVLVLWTGIIAVLVGIIQYGKKSDVDSMKAILHTDDDDLAKNALEIEEEEAQIEALEEEKKEEQDE